LQAPFCWSQNTTVYKNLEKKKFYSVSSGYTTVNGKTIYTVNGKTVDKATYDKYSIYWENMSNCCPCILEFYDINDKLIRESVQCTDCPVGYSKTFYENGKVQLYAQYKENSTGNWDNIFDRGYCHVPDGEWTYFSENGDTLYQEFWKDGQFIQQIPEQTKLEVWDVKPTLDNKELENDETINLKDIGRMILTPFFKNSSQDQSGITIKLDGSLVGYQTIEKEIPISDWKNLDWQKMMDDKNIPKGASVSFYFTIHLNGEWVDRFWLKVRNR
jgi:antitoxin component YwqK of YwqJK toxin-antitoxin module